MAGRKCHGDDTARQHAAAGGTDHTPTSERFRRSSRSLAASAVKASSTLSEYLHRTHLFNKSDNT